MERPKEIEGVRIIAEISRSASSLVLKGYQPQLERFVLVKCLANLNDDNAFAERFRREAVILARLSDPSIPSVFDYGSTEATAHIIAEFVDGIDLSRVLDDRPLPLPIALRVAGECAKALRAAHEKGILHRDLKPDNVMLGFSGRVYLTDFGLAGFMHEPGHRIAGTPAYLAPELIVGDVASEKSDLFALGATLLEALLGEPAFSGSSTSDVLEAVATVNPIPRLELAGIPADVCSLIADLLEKDPAERVASAAEAAERIQSLIAARDWSIDAIDLEAFLADPGAEMFAPSGLASHVAEHGDAPESNKPRNLDAPVAAAPAESQQRRRYAIAALPVAAILTVAIVLVAGLRQTEPDVSSRTLGANPAQVDSAAYVQPDRQSATKQAHEIADGSDTHAATAGQDRAAPPAIDSTTAKTDYDSRGEPTAAPIRDLSQAGSLALDTTSSKRTVNGAGVDSVGGAQASGAIVVDVVPWGYVSVDDSLVGRSPLSEAVSVQPGVRYVRVTHPTLPSVADSVVVEAGQTNRVALSLWDAVARVQIVVVPWAAVAVDGSPWETTPHRSPLVLLPGSYELTLEHPSYPKRTVTYEAFAGASDTLTVNMSDEL